MIPILGPSSYQIQYFEFIAIHMWLIDFLNPYELEQSWEWTFLKQFSIGNTKWGLKFFFTDGLLRNCEF